MTVDSSYADTSVCMFCIQSCVYMVYIDSSRVDTSVMCLYGMYVYSSRVDTSVMCLYGMYVYSSCVDTSVMCLYGMYVYSSRVDTSVMCLYGMYVYSSRVDTSVMCLYGVYVYSSRVDISAPRSVTPARVQTPKAAMKRSKFAAHAGVVSGTSCVMRRRPVKPRWNAMSSATSIKRKSKRCVPSDSESNSLLFTYKR